MAEPREQDASIQDTGIKPEDLENVDACIMNGTKRDHVFHWVNDNARLGPHHKIVQCMTCGQIRDRSRQVDKVIERGTVQPVRSDLGASGTAVPP